MRPLIKIKNLLRRIVGADPSQRRPITRRRRPPLHVEQLEARELFSTVAGVTASNQQWSDDFKSGLGSWETRPDYGTNISIATWSANENRLGISTHGSTRGALLGQYAGTNYTFRGIITTDDVTWGKVSLGVRMQDFFHGYLVSWAAATDCFTIAKENGSSVTTLASSVPTQLTANCDHLFSFSANGNYLSFSVDGKLQATTTDSAYPAGKIGIVVGNSAPLDMTKWYTTVYIGNLSVTSVPEPPSVAPISNSSLTSETSATGQTTVVAVPATSSYITQPSIPNALGTTQFALGSLVANAGIPVADTGAVIYQTTPAPTSPSSLPGLLAFKSGILGAPPVHQQITTEALPDLNVGIRKQIIDANVDTDENAISFATSSHHFDNNQISESVSYINSLYRQALSYADPAQFNSNALAVVFGQILHTVQDFYAHTNWVELGKTDLIDSGLGYWHDLTPYTVHQGVMVVEGEPPPILTLSQQGAVVTVTTDDDQQYPGLISGTFSIPGSFGTADHLPANIVMTHSDLNKDDASRTGYPVAYYLATQQTEHELDRLIALVNKQYGQAGVDKLSSEWLSATDLAMPLPTMVAGDSTTVRNDGIPFVPAIDNFAGPMASMPLDPWVAMYQNAMNYQKTSGQSGPVIVFIPDSSALGLDGAPTLAPATPFTPPSTTSFAPAQVVPFISTPLTPFAFQPQATDQNDGSGDTSPGGPRIPQNFVPASGVITPRPPQQPVLQPFQTPPPVLPRVPTPPVAPVEPAVAPPAIPVNQVSSTAHPTGFVPVTQVANKSTSTQPNLLPVSQAVDPGQILVTSVGITRVGPGFIPVNQAVTPVVTNAFGVPLMGQVPNFEAVNPVTTPPQAPVASRAVTPRAVTPRAVTPRAVTPRGTAQ